jgi:hypothetical protein
MSHQHAAALLACVASLASLGCGASGGGPRPAADAGPGRIDAGNPQDAARAQDAGRVVADATAASDGAASPDSGRLADAGRGDAGRIDAGGARDAGVDAGRDAGPPFDAGPEIRCELELRDITRAVRTGAELSGTEYFSSGMGDMDGGGHGREIYLIGADLGGGTPFLLDYAGASYPGYLIVTHTFGAFSTADFQVEIDYVDLAGATHTLTVYFPMFATVGGNKATFLVGTDGSTYWLDPEHDGYTFVEELFTRGQACRPDNLARAAP